MKKYPRVFADHILECIGLIEGCLRGKPQEEFLGSAQLQDAVIRRVEMIGEAAKDLPQDFKEKHPDIPRKEMAGMRVIIAHEYFGVDLKLTWRVATKDLPKLEAMLAE